jgi:putative DNA primase/helicase
MKVASKAILELLLLAQWVLWRYEPRESDGKPTKILYSARSGRRASSTDTRTWTNYEEVEAARAADPEHWQGVGFVVSSTDPYCGIDLDHCIGADGVIADWALAIVRRMNSYTEITPSGRGLRIWIKGTLPPFGRKKTWQVGSQQFAIEMYDEGRYFTVTGRHWAGTPETIEERQAELEALHAEVFPVRQKAAAVQKPSDPLNETDDQLLDRAMRSKRGEKFRRLWEGGLTDYANDWSRADLALCSLLRFWTQGDAARIDRLFRQSGLIRAKWDRPLSTGTYGSVTIAKALPGEIYDPGRLGRVPGRLVPSVFSQAPREPWAWRENRSESDRPGRTVRSAGLPPLVRPKGVPLPPLVRPRGVALNSLEARG